MLGTTGHHRGQGTGCTVSQSEGVGVPRAVSELQGTGWGGPGDGDIILPGKAWELSSCVCRGLLEVRTEIQCKHCKAMSARRGASSGEPSVGADGPAARSGGGCGVRVAPASLARSCLDPVAPGGRPRTGQWSWKGAEGRLRAGQRAALGPGSALEGLLIPKVLLLVLFSCATCLCRD